MSVCRVTLYAEEVLRCFPLQNDILGKHMEIVWYGHSCFRLRSREAVIVTDPFKSSIGYSMPKTTADIVTISHHHDGHDGMSEIGGDPKILDMPGEFEISGALIVGV